MLVNSLKFQSIISRNRDKEYSLGTNELKFIKWSQKSSRRVDSKISLNRMFEGRNGKFIEKKWLRKSQSWGIFPKLNQNLRGPNRKIKRKNTITKTIDRITLELIKVETQRYQRASVKSQIVGAKNQVYAVRKQNQRRLNYQTNQLT